MKFWSLAFLLLPFLGSAQWEEITPLLNIDTSLIQELEAAQKPVEFPFVVEKAHYPGGDQAFQKFVNQRETWNCLRENFSDTSFRRKILVQMIVEVDSTFHDLKIIRGMTPEMDSCLQAYLMKMPPWIPAKGHDECPVKSIVHFPIEIRYE